MFKESENFVPDPNVENMTHKVEVLGVDVQDISEKQEVEKYYELLNQVGSLTREGREVNAFEIRRLRTKKDSIRKKLESFGVAVDEVRPEDYNEE